MDEPPKRPWSVDVPASVDARTQAFRTINRDLLSRMAPDGGFGERPGASTRADATAWAILVLRTSRTHIAALARARARLAEEQRADGRVCVSRAHPDAHWPTALSVLAWKGSPEHREAEARAVRFLLETTGVHYRRDPDDPVAHDTLIQGWPWVDGTHSWVEPTAAAVWALRTVGQGAHPRVQDAIRLLLDRQLPQGGWNYGNTRVFGRRLDPTPEHTGAALHALAGCVARAQIAASLAYLQHHLVEIRTPIALGWSLLGLRAWNAVGDAVDTGAMVGQCLARQARYGLYDTGSLSLLLLSLLAPADSNDAGEQSDAGSEQF